MKKRQQLSTSSEFRLSFSFILFYCLSFFFPGSHQKKEARIILLGAFLTARAGRESASTSFLNEAPVCNQEFDNEKHSTLDEFSPELIPKDGRGALKLGTAATQILR
jgi:hypothetical protein